MTSYANISNIYPSPEINNISLSFKKSKCHRGFLYITHSS